jgi:fermentation-respiration switch protein FrsA (DUF1100 family)
MLYFLTVILPVSSIVLLVVYAISLSFCVARKVMYPRRKTLEDAAKLQAADDIYHPSDLDGTIREEVPLQSVYGYPIHAFIIRNAIPSEHVVILSHGVTCRSELMFRYLKIYLDMGYNVLFMDHRGHGQSGCKVVSYGYFEKHDLASAIHWAREHFSGRIGLHGESMGAGISMQSLELADVDFIIEDCGYSNFGDEIYWQLKKSRTGLAWLQYPCTRLWIRILGGYDIQAVSPIRSMRKATIPALIIHGTEDDHVPFMMASELYNAIPHSQKHLYTPEAGHAGCIKSNPAAYRQQVKTFLQTYGMYYGA